MQQHSTTPTTTAPPALALSREEIGRYLIEAIPSVRPLTADAVLALILHRTLASRMRTAREAFELTCHDAVQSTLDSYRDAHQIEAARRISEHWEEWVKPLLSDEPRVLIDFADQAEDPAAGKGGPVIVDIMLALVTLTNRSQYWRRDERRDSITDWTAIFERYERP